jgi:hypothetical protein
MTDPPRTNAFFEPVHAQMSKFVQAAKKIGICWHFYGSFVALISSRTKVARRSGLPAGLQFPQP